MALIICKECGEYVSDNAAACPHCGNRMIFPLPDFRDIVVTSDVDRDYYYDKKNGRDLDAYQYSCAKQRYEEECKKRSDEYYQTTQSIIDFINDPSEPESWKATYFSLVLTSDELSRQYNKEELQIMRNFLKAYKEKKARKGK